EELVEHRREDGAEANALEEREAAVRSEIEHAGVVVEERQLSVDEPVPDRKGSFLRANGSHRETHHDMPARPRRGLQSGYETPLRDGEVHGRGGAGGGAVDRERQERVRL